MFYVEKYADEYGNFAYGHAVIEGEIHGRVLMIAAPEEIAGKWTSVYTDVYGGFKEVPGPARLITREEHVALLNSEILFN